MDALRTFSSFFNAEELHQKVAKKNIGLATIYRFLKERENQGEVHAYICNKRRIYSLGKKNHTHFSCESCNKVAHLHLKNVDFLDSIPEKICHFQIDITGICALCSRK